MFKPSYIISERLLANIKKISLLVESLNNRRFPRVILTKLEKTARAVSTYASTSIEGNPLPLTEVKKILKSKPSYVRTSEQEVLNYNEALKMLQTKLKKGKIKLSTDFILKIHKQVGNKIMPVHETGKLRVKPVIVNDPLTGKVVYLPPDAKDVHKLIEHIVVFVNDNKNKIDPLILAGIFHKQFVIIHPFMDGNGRAARLATKVLLAEMGLNTFYLFSFENYYNNNVTRYFQKVGEYGSYYELVDKIEFTDWLEYFTEGIIDELLRVEKLLPKRAITPAIVLKPFHKKILDFIKEKGLITDRDYAKIVNRAKATRALDFQFLIKRGFIKRKGRGRATYYILKDRL